MNDLKALGRMIEIVGGGHAVSTSVTKAVGDAGPNVRLAAIPAVPSSACTTARV